MSFGARGSVLVVSKSNCSYCDVAKDALSEAGIEYSVMKWEEMPESDRAALTQLVQPSKLTFPQVFVGTKRMGCRELVMLMESDDFGTLMREEGIETKLDLHHTEF